METEKTTAEQRTFGTADPRCDGMLDELAGLTYGHAWNDLTPTERQELALTACKLLSLDQGRRVCTARGVIDPKCGPGCPLHEPFGRVTVNAGKTVSEDGMVTRLKKQTE